MNIILQNYKNLIQELIKTHFSNKIDNVINNFNSSGDINNYINLLSSFDNNMSLFLCEALKDLLEKLDYNYCKSIERKKNIILNIKLPELFLLFLAKLLILDIFINLKLIITVFVILIDSLV